MQLEHDRLFNFNEKCLKVFVELKKALVIASVVIVPDWSMPFELSVMLVTILLEQC